MYKQLQLALFFLHIIYQFSGTNFLKLLIQVTFLMKLICILLQDDAHIFCRESQVRYNLLIQIS